MSAYSENARARLLPLTQARNWAVTAVHLQFGSMQVRGRVPELWDCMHSKKAQWSSFVLGLGKHFNISNAVSLEYHLNEEFDKASPIQPVKVGKVALAERLSSMIFTRSPFRVSWQNFWASLKLSCLTKWSKIDVQSLAGADVVGLSVTTMFVVGIKPERKNLLYSAFGY
jgi:hypothetical protein